MVYQRVSVSAPSRFHLTLTDLNGAFSGRVDGGVGFALSNPRFEIVAAPASGADRIACLIEDPEDRLEAEGAIAATLSGLKKKLGLPPVNITVKSPVSSHAGLGSKTALLLGVARAYTALFGNDFAGRELARFVGRGGTSGIGSNSFDKGGLVIDCGHPAKVKAGAFMTSGWATDIPPGPLLARYKMPYWPMLLVTPIARKIHGALEQELFASVCPIPQEDVRAVCHITMMMLVPSVIEDDPAIFARGINELQKCRWKSHQIQCQSEVVSTTMRRLHEMGVSGVAMSSWGSSILAMGPEMEDGAFRSRVSADIKQVMDRYDGGTVGEIRCDNEGHRLRTFKAPALVD